MAYVFAVTGVGLFVFVTVGVHKQNLATWRGILCSKRQAEYERIA